MGVYKRNVVVATKPIFMGVYFLCLWVLIIPIFPQENFGNYITLLRLLLAASQTSQVLKLVTDNSRKYVLLRLILPPAAII